MHRLHATKLAKAIRNTPGVNSVAMKWWIHSQTKMLHQIVSEIPPPLFNQTASLRPPALPPSRDLGATDGPAMMGDAFSEEMARFSLSSKFHSLGYQDLYALILEPLRDSNAHVLEIGIGINDPTAVSGMGCSHEVGTSLRGWSGYLRNATVIGADISHDALVAVRDFQVHWVDQRDSRSLMTLADKLSDPLDLIVDDGLHTPEANARTMSSLLPKLSSRGTMVIEDILPWFNEAWESVSKHLPPPYTLRFYPGHSLRGSKGEGLAVIHRA